MTAAEAVAVLSTRRDNARKSEWPDPALHAEVEAYATALDIGIEAIDRLKHVDEALKTLLPMVEDVLEANETLARQSLKRWRDDDESNRAAIKRCQL